MQSSRRSGSLIFSLLFFILIGVALWQRWAVYDFVRLRGYSPTQAVANLATATSMNDRTRRLFYVYHPALEDKATFNTHCTDSEKTVVLGCYIAGRGIYVYDVNDPRLNGIKEVTSAHEVLHAAYDRLGSKDKEHINQLLLSAYAGVTDKRIRSTIDNYKQEGADTTNELHSILGTEVRNLPPELEAYYKRYFTDRTKIVALSEQYQQAFTERQNKLAQYDAQLKELQGQIESMQASLTNQEQSLSAQRAQLDTWRNQKQFEQYNAAVPGFNAAVNRYNADVRAAQALIEQFNALVVERNALAVEENQLIKAIDSRPSTIETQ
jgi:hypothetical protein